LTATARTTKVYIRTRIVVAAAAAARRLVDYITMSSYCLYYHLDQILVIHQF
jgi:hypothetical protein